MLGEELEKEDDGGSRVDDGEIFHPIMEFLELFHISVDFAFKRDTCYFIKSNSCQPQLIIKVAYRQKKIQLFGNTKLSRPSTWTL